MANLRDQLASEDIKRSIFHSTLAYILSSSFRLDRLLLFRIACAGRVVGFVEQTNPAMTLTYLSSGADPHCNDDHVAVFSAPGVTDLLVIDGGTSVAERDYIEPDIGDVAWFVRSFAAEIGRNARADRSQQESVDAAVAAVRTAFEQAGGHEPVPVHAWPIAALTWVRIAQHGRRSTASLYSLGDCKTLLRTPDGAVCDPDPFSNPQEAVLQAEIARLRAEGVTDAAQRRERMLPMLRARREAQNLSPAPTVLCVQPHGSFQARMRSFELAPGAALLVMTDGFYRLVDTYGLHTDAGLIAHAEARGLEAVLEELRTFEQATGNTGERAVKAADDASAAFWLAR